MQERDWEQSQCPGTSSAVSPVQGDLSQLHLPLHLQHQLLLLWYWAG